MATRKTRTTPPASRGAGEDAAKAVPAPAEGIERPDDPPRSEAGTAAGNITGSETGSETGEEVRDTSPREVLRRKAFLEQVAARSGIRKSDTRAVTEAALSVIADALQRGEDVALPPLGRIRVVKSREGDRSRILTLRLSLPSGPAGSLSGEDGPEPDPDQDGDQDGDHDGDQGGDP